MLFFILLLLLVAVAVWGGYRLLKLRRNANTVDQETSAVEKLSVEGRGRRLAFWRRGDRYQMGRDLQAWVSDNLTDKTAKPWVEELSPEAAQQTAQALQAFADQNGFDVKGLLAGDYNDSPEVRKALKEAITKFLAAYTVMDRAAGDMTVYAQYQQIVAGKEIGRASCRERVFPVV